MAKKKKNKKKTKRERETNIILGKPEIYSSRNH